MVTAQESGQAALAKIEIVRVQIERFHEFYADYFRRPDTHAMVEYFFDRIYSLDTNQEWRRLALGTFQNVKHLVRDSTRENIEHLIELNELTETLDQAMAERLIARGFEAQKLSTDDYLSLYIECGHEQERKRHLELAIKNMRSFYDLAHRPINSILIKPARFTCKALGIYPLFAPVEEGYYAVLHIPRDLFQSFVDEVERKEWEYVNAAFGV